MHIQLVQLPKWHQAQGHGATSCHQHWSHVHSTGSVAVMASGTRTWGDVLSPTLLPCPFNWFSCRNGIRHKDMSDVLSPTSALCTFNWFSCRNDIMHRDMRRRTVTNTGPMFIQLVQLP
ncbi:hypothetical protein AVEN_240185-1 [Araneus ventricosus]|uniref:Uncharacterized protein n=1 Tax=Araneus ventricosus TaxID=182803 RepID=A0A4Y2IWU4_ARAVE|nr:hypothetical protein AVEN_240185-1 [Araneus ventricosus]